MEAAGRALQVLPDTSGHPPQSWVQGGPGENLKAPTCPAASAACLEVVVALGRALHEADSGKRVRWEVGMVEVSIFNRLCTVVRH